MVGRVSAEGLYGQLDTITMVGDATIAFQGRSVPYGNALAGEPGAPVGLTDAMTVGLIETGTPYGVLIRVEADKTVVVGKGGVQAFRIGATAPTPGSAVEAGAGNVVVDAATGGIGVVIDVDEANGIAWVDLG